jgi:hypothetical protein
MYQNQESGFITTDLFNEWSIEILFPSFGQTWRALAWDGPGLVILDDCRCHSRDFFLDKSTHRGVQCLFLPPHSSDEIQCVDRGAFAVEKSEASRSRPHAGLSSQPRDIIKLVHGHRRATCRDTIIGAFRRAGITAEWDPIRKILFAKVCQSLPEKCEVCPGLKSLQGADSGAR